MCIIIEDGPGGARVRDVEIRWELVQGLLCIELEDGKMGWGLLRREDGGLLGEAS